ncbi:MAG: hypothetical protein GY944_03490 [bacterium]|nr:hypothetical protein [bacterium]
MHSLSPSSAKAPDRRDGLRDTSSARPEPTAKRKKKKAAKPKPSAEVSLDQEVGPDAGQTGSEGGVGLEQIRALVHGRPDCLEGGLSIYTDDNADPVGIDFETEVGHVDLLARDGAGGLVAVMLVDDRNISGKDLVSAALERVGWVRKHVAEPQQEVRAIVLLEHVPDDTSYTAAAVASTVAFKTWRLEISFNDVEM